MFLLTFVAASAVTVTVGDVTLSLDEAVKRSNPAEAGSDDKLDDKKDLEYVTFNIPVTAIDGSVTISALSIDLSSFTYKTIDDEVTEADKLKIITTFPVTVTNATTTNIVVEVLVPSNLDSVDSSFNRVQFTLPVTTTTSLGSIASLLKFYAENGVTMSDVNIETVDSSIKCDVDEAEDVGLSCDDEADELRPGESFDIDFDVSNEFGSSTDVDLEDFEIVIESDESDVDASPDDFDDDINANEDFTYYVTFDVDEDVDDGTKATITIEGLGEDVNGAQHGFRHEFDIKFQIPDYVIEVRNVELSDSSICHDETTTLTWEVENTGAKDQRNVRFQIKNNALDLEKSITGVQIQDEDERDNSFDGQYIIELPNDVQEGSYTIQLTTFFQDGSRSSDGDFELESVSLRVDDCRPETTPNTENSGNTGSTTNTGSNTGTTGTTGTAIIPTTPTIPSVTQPPQAQQPVPAVVSNNKGGSGLALAGLIVLILVLLVVIGFIVSVLMRR